MREPHLARCNTAAAVRLVHPARPHLPQTYTYVLEKVTGREGTKLGHALRGQAARSALLTEDSAEGNQGQGAHGWEVQLVLEYCDRGSLRDALGAGALNAPGGEPNYLWVLDTALEVCRAMVHLHSENIIHSDLKARNVSGWGRWGCLLAQVLAVCYWGSAAIVAAFLGATAHHCP